MIYISFLIKREIYLKKYDENIPMNKPVTHIVAVGFSYEEPTVKPSREATKLIQSIVEHGQFNKIITLVSKKHDSPGEDRVRETSKEIEDRFKALLVEVERKEIDKQDTQNAILDIIKIVKEEKKSSNVWINASSSKKNIVIASYIAGSLTNTNVYTSTLFDDKNYSGEVKLLPVKSFSKEQLLVLFALRGGRIDSISSLVEKVHETNKLHKIKLELKRTEKIESERAKWAHHLRLLEKEGLIERETARKGIKLTKWGEIFAEANDNNGSVS
ncbi:hypothetical protein BMS3Bbin16_00546 [archaeon BMS3Bbin16]|nr:hypothetical protein BMS3Bbin16_00546 [archaeon BMS3Bbin16]